MNRAEFEAINNRIAAVEARCDLLERENERLKAQPLEAAVAAEQSRVTEKAGKRAGSF
jgi:hypothetical protein